MDDLPECVHRSSAGWCYHYQRGQFLSTELKVSPSGGEQHVFTEPTNFLCKDAPGCAEGLK